MTEQEWLACADLNRMVSFLQPRVSWRKLRLFACACCRHVGQWLTDETIRNALNRAELYAEGRIKAGTAQTWYKKSCAVRDSLPKAQDFRPEWLACHAVAEAVIGEPYSAYLHTHKSVVHAITRANGAESGSAPWRLEMERGSVGLVWLLRDIVGNPFHVPHANPDWLSLQRSTVSKLAGAIYEDRTFDRLPLLADALEDAGCTDPDILAHCRGPGPHVRGCWVIDLLTGRQ